MIIFLDEPGLAGFGSSAFITVSAELVLRLLAEVVDAVHAAGGLAGIHVCANTDWLLAFQSNFDIINFDSYGYFDKFALYRKECLQFMAEGGNIAWGIVPTSDLDAIRAETPESLAGRWTGQDPGACRRRDGDRGSNCSLAFYPELRLRQLCRRDYAARVLDLLKGFCRIVVRANTAP